ncbi:hypothetical protein HK101_005722 [Irineochytrium annulatum]|nr:hypothetical protein HK101_005722 [Irineochytrium annulatum]
MNGRRDGAAAGSARGSDQAPLASSIPPPAQAPTQSRYAARLSWLSSLEKDSDSLSQRVDRMAKDHTILTKTKATNAVFDSAPAVVASPTGQTGPASDFFSRRASFNGPRSSVDSASSEQGSKRWSTLSTASAPIETTGRISMDRQGSSGLASLVSTLESAKDKRSSVKVAPPPTPDKHWPKVRELVKTMEKKKPDLSLPAVQSPSTTSPGASPQRKNSLKSLLTPTRSMTTSPSSTPSPKPAAKPARPASMYILPPVSQSSSFAVSLATTASNPATTATLSRSTSSYGRRTPSQSPSRPWLATTTPPSSSFIAAAASLPTPPAVERTPSVAEISKRLKEIQPSTSFTAAAASLPTPPAIERTPSVAEISKRLEETMKAAVCASPVSTAPPLPVLPATGNVSRRISSLSPTGRAKSTEGGRTASNARMRNSVVIEKAVVVEDVNVPATVVDAFEALKAWEEKSPASVVDAFTTEANKEKSPASVETAVKAVEIAVDVIPASGGDSGSKLVFKPRTSSLRMDPGVAALPLVKPQETSIVEKVPRRTQSTMEINQDEPRGRTLSVRPQKSVPDMKDVVTPTETSFSKSVRVPVVYCLP